MSAEATYFGSVGRHLRRLQSYNNPEPSQLANTNLARPFPKFGSVQVMNAPSSSRYNALYLKLQRRFSQGLSFLTSFSYGKSTDNGSGIRTSDGDSLTPSNNYDLELETGLSAFDFRRRWTTSWLWDLPFGRDTTGSSLADLVLGGWQLGGIMNLADGSPLTVSIATPAALAALGVGAQGSAFTPNLIAGGNLNPVTGDPDHYFDDSQFVFPAARTLGNVGRNTLIAPGIANVDLGLTKNIALPKTSRMQVRVEVFNLFNRANLGAPSTQVFNAAGVRSGNVGFIGTTSTTARQIQLGLRLDW
jgi:hypothetical protein